MNSPQNPFEKQDGLPFGREEVVREIFDRLGSNLAQGPGSFSLVGPKYIGKTTVLRSLLAVAVIDRFLGSAKELLCPVYVDCSELPPLRKEVFGLLGKTALETARTKWNVQFDSSVNSQYITPLEVGSEIPEVTCAFEGLLRELSSRQGRHVVFLLDNFEKLLALFTESDVHFLRDVFSNTKHALVVATPKPIREYSQKTFPSRFYEIFKPYHLHAFSSDEAYGYLTHSSTGSARELSHSEKGMVLTKTGAHPHFLRAYASEMWQRKLKLPADETLRIFDKVDRRARMRLNGDFLSIWSALDRESQTALYEFAAEHITEREIMRALQRLEEEYALVFRRENGHFEVMGELFKEFVISQTEVIALLLKTDFYRAGLKALEQIRGFKYFDTDPEYYYHKAFQQFTSLTPDYDSANAMIRSTFERVLDVMVKRSESSLGQPFSGGGYKDRFNFVEQAFEIEERVTKLVSEFWNLANSDGPHAGSPANMYNTQLRFYLLSGVMQYLLAARQRK